MIRMLYAERTAQAHDLVFAGRVYIDRFVYDIVGASEI